MYILFKCNETFHQYLRCLVIRRPSNVLPWVTMGADEAIRCKTIYLSAMSHFIRVYAVCQAGLGTLRSRRFFNPQLYRSIDEESNQNLYPSPPMDSCACTFNGFPISSDFCRLLITYANSLDPDQDQRAKKTILKKKSQQTPTKAGKIIQQAKR